MISKTTAAIALMIIGLGMIWFGTYMLGKNIAAKPQPKKFTIGGMDLSTDCTDMMSLEGWVLKDTGGDTIDVTFGKLYLHKGGKVYYYHPPAIEAPRGATTKRPYRVSAGTIRIGGIITPDTSIRIDLKTNK